MQTTIRSARQPFLIVLFFVLVILLGTVAAAASADSTPPTVYGARAMGMGGAYTAVADDAAAMYWSPAALGLKKLSLNGSAGLAGLEDMDELAKLVADPAALAELGDKEGFGAHAAALVGLNIGSIGVIGILDGDVAVESPHVTAELRKTAGIGLARNVITWGGGLFGVRAGLVGRVIEAERSQVTLPSLDEFKDEGKGYAVDFGLHVRITDIFTAAGSVRNAIGEFTWEEGGEDDPTTEYRLGVAVKPPLLGLTVAADITSTSEIRYGAEKTLLFGLIRLRGGQIHSDDNGTWTTAGVGLALGPLAVDAALITPETTFKDNHYSVEASIRF